MKEMENQDEKKLIINVIGMCYGSNDVSRL